MNRLIRAAGHPAVARVTDQELGRMLAALPWYSLRAGMGVLIVMGQYAGLDGVVRGVSGNKVRVELTLRSRNCEVVVDKGMVKPSQE